MVVEFEQYKKGETKENMEMGAAQKELLHQPCNKKGNSGKGFSRLVNYLDGILVTMQTSHWAKNQIPIRSYIQEKGEKCPVCGSNKVGWVHSDYYPDGVDTYIKEIMPDASSENTAVKMEFPERELLQCIECHKIIDVYGSLLLHAQQNECVN